MFEMQLCKTLRELNMDNFLPEFLQWLRDCAEGPCDPQKRQAGGVRPEELDAFLGAAAAVESYEMFLEVMFAEVRWQFSGQTSSQLHEHCQGQEPQLPQLPQTLQAPPLQQQALEQQQPTTQEIEVCVPEGFYSGHRMLVEYLGSRYELDVPEGAVPGSSFHVLVALP